MALLPGRLHIYRSVVLWIAAVVLSAGTASATAQESAAAGSTGPALDIAVVETPAQSVLFLEHAAPYWRLGAVFRRVEQHRRKTEQAGPMFARFCGPPLAPSSARCTTQVGYFVSDDAQASSPFELARWDAQLFASATVDTVVTSMRRHYEPMFDWIAAEGYEPTGPVVEVYHSDPNDRTARRRTEIRIAVRRLEQDSERPQDAARVEAPPISGDSVVEPEGSATVGLGAPPADGPAEEEVAGVDAVADGVAPPQSTSTARTDRDLAAVASPPDLTRPVRDLAADEQWDAVAEKLMPGGVEIPAATQVWFGHLVFRIGAVAKGMRQLHAVETHKVILLADAISSRYRLVSRRFSRDPLAQAVVRVEANGDPDAAVKDAILQDVNALLGRTAVKAVTPDEAFDILLDVAERTHGVLHDDRP